MSKNDPETKPKGELTEEQAEQVTGGNAHNPPPPPPKSQP